MENDGEDAAHAPVPVLAALRGHRFVAGSPFALDCAALADTGIPFALPSAEATTRRAGDAATTRSQQTQVFRRGGEVTTYAVDSPAIYLRAGGANSPVPGGGPASPAFVA